MRKRLLVTAIGVAVLAGCGSNKPKTIGSLTYVPPAEEEEIIVDPLNHQEVRTEYDELMELVEDQHLKEQIERRVADVYMMEGVHDQNQAAPTKSHYVEAIKAYRNILEKYPDSPDNAEVLYQLAKAYDMEGDQSEAMEMLAQLTSRHPGYPNIAEAHFRMGDIHFNNQNYSSAQASYQAVTQLDNERLTTNARYMLGWSYYKQSQFGNSLKEFAVVLDGLLTNVTDIEELGDAERPMAADTIHSISLALDKVGGAEAITTMPIVANKNYVWMLYDNLGGYYLEKERYENSAATYRSFVKKHGTSDKAPVLHDKIIHTYIEGGFPSLALNEKEAFVAAYGIYSNYPGNRDGMKPKVAASIHTYLDELARHYYNQGHTLREIDGENAAPSYEERSEGAEQIAEVSDGAIKAYSKAAAFYAQFAETFSDDKRIDEVYFLKSESLFLAQRYADAIPGYERVAYRPTGKSAEQHASNAGYAAIISYQEHLATLPPKSRKAKNWQAQAVESMLLYANTFHADSRAVSVLTNAAEYLFSLDEYARALQVASALIENNEALDKSLKKTAYGIIAHSHFNLGDYHNAELNYIHQRKLISPESEEYQKVSERLATAIYRKAGEIDAQGDSNAAVAQLLKIKQLTPNSELRVPSQYEAATMLIGMKEWQRAIVELNELASSYPEHELAVEFRRRLAFAYEQSENWLMAASSYLYLAEHDPDAVVKQEALYIAATMYEKAKNYLEAINHFRAYANTYESPANTLMEARYNLAINYQRIGDVDKYLFWLDKIVQGEQQFESTERFRWLSAWANTQYGDYHARQFDKYALSLPLVKSLPKKNELLESASNRYQMAAEMGVLEFSTLSSFRVADLYHQFADELRRSPRPSLSEEEQPIYDQIIEEQALPFDQLAMELHQANIDRAWDGKFDEWIDKSFAAMRTLNPQRFDKAELIVSYGDEIR